MLLFAFVVLQDASSAPGAASSSASNDNDLYCSTCNVAFDSIHNMHAHLKGNRHRVTLLAQQLRASGSMHANQQGMVVSELPDGLVIPVRAEQVGLVIMCLK
jgi:hypothetical protein